MPTLGLTTDGAVQPFGVVAMLLFLAAFVAIVVHALTRPRAEVERHARLPLDETDPTGDRDPAGSKRGLS